MKFAPCSAPNVPGGAKKSYNKSMKAAIITIGDEILLGQIMDTNSRFIARELAALGVETVEMFTVADEQAAIVRALDTAFLRADLLFITGGLGPTKDDLTKKTLAEYFHTPLVFNPQVYAWLEEMLLPRRGEVNAYNKSQAVLPQDCTVLRNRKGTASGMWFEKDGRIAVSLPGVPFEMEHLMTEEVLPLLRKKCAEKLLAYRLLHVFNIPEAELAMRLQAFEEQLPAGVGLAYLPSVDEVKLRVTAKGSALPLLDGQTEKLKTCLQGLHFTEGETSGLVERLAAVFTQKKLTLASAESCTGGNIAHWITALPGASDYYLGGVVSYANQVKAGVLGVSTDDLKTHGAVSEPVAKQMAAGARRVTGADWAVSTTGIAGPGGGTPEKPVGTVWIGLAGPHGVEARKFLFSSTRERNIGKASAQALEWVLSAVLKTK